MAAAVGNKYAIGNNGGRPPHYETPEDVIAVCDEYFEYIKESNEPATVTGLALYLGFSSKSSLFDYEKKEEFSSIIKKARTRVEHEYEKRLHGDKNAGAIFALKNMDWDDKVKQELSGGFVWQEQRTDDPNV